MADSTYVDIKKRVAALQEKAIPASTAYPRFMVVAARFPYWTNRLSTATNEFNSEQIFDETRTLTMRLVIGHVTAKYEGENDQLIDDYINDVYNTFLEINAMMLVDGTTYTDEPTYLHPLGSDLTAGDTGLAFFEAPWTGAVFEVGVEFTLTVYLCREISQA